MQGQQGRRPEKTPPPAPSPTGTAQAGGGRPATSGAASAPCPLREPSGAPRPGTALPAPPQPLRRSGRSCPGWPGPARRAPPAAPPRRRTPACGRQHLSGCRGTTPPRPGRRLARRRPCPEPTPLTRAAAPPSWNCSARPPLRLHRPQRPAVATMRGKQRRPGGSGWARPRRGAVLVSRSGLRDSPVRQQEPLAWV